MRHMKIEKHPYGKLPDGKKVFLFTLSNEPGMEVDITNYGGIVTAIRIPDKSKNPGDVVLGFDRLEGYLGEHPYFGAIVGRFANRISRAAFVLDGKKYKLAANQGNNHLHGGIKGFDKVVWTPSVEKKPDAVTLKLGYNSPDMEEGYPGNLMVEVDYTLNDRNELVIEYRTSTDKKTHVNLTNHSYFNLNNCRGDILDHILMIDADRVTELNDESIPTGRILEVEGTCFDFRAAKPVGQDIAETAPGYDINYVVNNYDGEMKRIAALYHEASGRSLDVLTTLPGVQLYTSNYIGSIHGKKGIEYKKHAAICLETQHFPDTPNQPDFPSTVLHPGNTYEQATIYRFKW
ncbi:MAG: galactose mutarotase [Bacteroidales bacterium]|nr:galactose mutarotase [Bacteroidales bacterium]